MADRTLQILPGGQSAAPYTYTVPASSEFMLSAVRAIFDGSGSASAWLPAVQIVSDAGVVMVEALGSSVAAGGSADASFFHLRRVGGGAVSNIYPNVVQTVGTLGTLRGYWRLGETAAPFHDTSGWVNGPTTMNKIENGTDYTTHVGGGLPPGVDDGALQLNAPVNGGDYAASASNAIWAGVQASFTVAAWVKPFPSVSNWRGGIFSNNGVFVDFPSHEEGWCLEGNWSGGTVQGRLTRANNNNTLSAAYTIPTNAWSSLIGTYDGTNIRLYVNSILRATQADNRVQAADAIGAPTVGFIAYRPAAVTSGQFYGVIDEVSYWGEVFDQTKVDALYAAGVAN